MEHCSDNPDELWDVLDADRNPTGKLHRRGDPLGAGEYHLVVHLCIFNAKNELLIQKRQPWKKSWPDLWDVTAAGSAQAGDTSRTAIEREVREELGLALDLSGERPLFTISFSHGFDDYWFVRQEVDIAALTLQETEVAAVQWATQEEVLALVRQGKFIPYTFADTLFEMMDWRTCHFRKFSGEIKPLPEVGK